MPDDLLGALSQGDVVGLVAAAWALGLVLGAIVAVLASVYRRR